MHLINQLGRDKGRNTKTSKIKEEPDFINQVEGSETRLSDCHSNPAR